MKSSLTVGKISHPEPAGLLGHIPSLLTIDPPSVTAQTPTRPILTCLKHVVCVPESEKKHSSIWGFVKFTKPTQNCRSRNYCLPMTTKRIVG